MFSVKKSNLFQLTLAVLMLSGSFFIGFFQKIYTAITQQPLDLTGTGGITFTQVGFIFIPVLIYLLINKGFFKNSLYLKSPGIFNVIMSLLLMVFLMPTTGLINYASQFFVKNHIEGAITSLNQYPYLVAILVAAVFPGIFEELKTRYLILNHYRYKPFYLSCIMSGLFFGMMHFNFNQFLYAFFLGVIFGYLVQVTGSIFISILMHFALNAFSVTVSYFSTNLEVAVETATQADVATLIGILGVNVITIPIALLILWKITQYNGKLAILKQKPTTLELTLGKKFAEYQPEQFTPNAAYSPAPNMPDSPAPNVSNQWYEAGQILNGPESYEIYQAKRDRAFNWAFWAYVVLFIAMSFIVEAIKYIA